MGARKRVGRNGLGGLGEANPDGSQTTGGRLCPRAAGSADTASPRRVDSPASWRPMVELGGPCGPAAPIFLASSQKWGSCIPPGVGTFFYAVLGGSRSAQTAKNLGSSRVPGPPRKGPTTPQLPIFFTAFEGT